MATSQTFKPETEKTDSYIHVMSWYIDQGSTKFCLASTQLRTPKQRKIQKPKSAIYNLDRRIEKESVSGE